MRIDPWWLLMLPLLGGCTLGPDFTPPHASSPASWFAAADKPEPATVHSIATETPIDPSWWRLFGDPVLTGFVERIAASNLDVRVAAERIAESRAQLRVTGADQYPTVDSSASYTRERQSANGVIGLVSGSGSDPATQTNGLGGRQGGATTGGAALPAFDLFQYGFDTSWELDLWGRVRRNVENAAAQTQAEVETRRDTLVSAMAEVAKDYLQYRGTQENLRITRDTLASYRANEALTEERARSGLATDLDVETAKSEVASAAASIAQLEQQAAQQINAIGLLLGEYPRALSDQLAARQSIPAPPPRLPVGVPSELLRRRPDIREAEANLHAATASIGVAKADFFPKVTLSGSFAIQALQFKDLGSWDSRSFSLGPSVSLPIFEGGKLTGTLQLREAQQREAAASYQKTVLSAFRDVDDSLTSFAAEQRRRDQLAEEVRASRHALSLAQDLYKRGLTDYLQVLTTERTLLSSQQSLADSTTTIATDLVALYKALGGGWDAPGMEVASVASAAVTAR